MSETRKKAITEDELNEKKSSAKSSSKKKEQSLEEKMLLLNDIIKKLEQDDNTLEDSFKLYKEGMQYLLECNAAIDTVEKELIILEGADDEL